ncbi:MAG: hypothetical protein JWR07_4460 [Nevskia sp.]|nr:hypothetical protein [Nevskia sp.]
MTLAYAARGRRAVVCGLDQDFLQLIFSSVGKRRHIHPAAPGMTRNLNSLPNSRRRAVSTRWRRSGGCERSWHRTGRHQIGLRLRQSCFFADQAGIGANAKAVRVQRRGGRLIARCSNCDPRITKHAWIPGEVCPCAARGHPTAPARPAKVCCPGHRCIVRSSSSKHLLPH